MEADHGPYAQDILSNGRVFLFACGSRCLGLNSHRRISDQCKDEPGCAAPLYISMLRDIFKWHFEQRTESTHYVQPVNSHESKDRKCQALPRISANLAVPLALSEELISRNSILATMRQSGSLNLSSGSLQVH